MAGLSLECPERCCEWSCRLRLRMRRRRRICIGDADPPRRCRRLTGVSGGVEKQQPIENETLKCVRQVMRVRKGSRR